MNQAWTHILILSCSLALIVVLYLLQRVRDATGIPAGPDRCPACEKGRPVAGKLCGRELGFRPQGGSFFRTLPVYAFGCPDCGHLELRSSPEGLRAMEGR